MRIVFFLLRRLASLVPLLLIVAFLTFVLLRLGGQDPSAMLAGPTATADEIARVRKFYELDRGLAVQFGQWLALVLHGDLGRSWLSGRPVLTDLLERAPVTLELLLLGVGLGTLIGIPAGLLAAFRAGRIPDHLTRLASLFGYSIPTYFLGLAMLLIFFYLLDWAPPGMGRISLLLAPPPRVSGSYLLDAVIAGDRDAARSAAAQLVLPVLCVAIICAAPVAAQVRGIVLNILASGHLGYARAQGLGRARIVRIVLRNAAVPVVTFVGAELVGLVGTASLIEYVFAWGGLGQYGLDAIIKGDFAVVQGYVLLLALFSVLVFLLVDLAVMALEPRAART